MSARFEDIAERYLDPKIRGTSEYMCACPFCKSEQSLQFNIDKGLWVCFRCDAKGNAERLVKKLGGTYTDPVITVEAIYTQMDRLRMQEKHKDRGTKILDERTLLRYSFPDEYWSEVRGFSDATIKEWELGYDPISDRNTIPYRNPEGELLGVIQRIKQDVQPRYIYPEGFDRKNSLFGSWKIKGRKAALVEGSTDVLALADSKVPGLAQYGSSISEGQYRLLHRLNIQEVVLFYDYDEAGRKAEERSRETLKGLVIRAARYEESKYCWHRKLCACGEGHTWRKIGQCPDKRLCKCGRVHEADPGSLRKKERRRMYEEAQLIGSKKQWRTHRSAQ